MTYTYLIYLLLFLPCVLLVYGLSPRRLRGKVLLAASYLFFFQMSKFLLCYLVFTTLSVYGVGRWLSAAQAVGDRRIQAGADKKAARAATTRRRRGILWLGVAAQVGILFFLKFFNFIGLNLNALLGGPFIPELKLALPIGISFYTLEAVSYLVDVYYRKVEAERSLGRLALFLAFFPAIMEGPICRYGETALPLWEGRPLEYRNVAFGAQRLLWGLFKKWVVADRLNPLVNTLFGSYDQYSGLVVALGAVLYTFQLYADFSGCIDMTIGTGEMLGVKLPENFRQPFFAKTPSEFWRRWHITLGAWFKDYIFYPLSLTGGIKRLGKSARKKLGKHYGQIVQTLVPLFAVWLSNGLWHGTGWNYLFYGMFYYVLIVLGELAEPQVERLTAALGINRSGRLWRLLQSVKMLVIIFTGELFFRAEGLRAGFAMFGSIFTGFGSGGLTDGSLLRLGLSSQDYLAVALGLGVMLAVGVLHENGVHIRERVAAWGIGWRWGFYYLALLAVLLLGAYGSGYTPAELIYAGF